MEEFRKEKGGMGEATRQMLNKSIDLLHKVSNRKIVGEKAKRELAEILVNHFVLRFGEGFRGKIRLQALLEETQEIIDKIDSGRTPLYEAIMQMNKAVMQIPQNMQEEEEQFAGAEFDAPGEIAEKQLKIGELRQLTEEPLQQNISLEQIHERMNTIFTLKQKLEGAVCQLNELLSYVGFELKSLTK